MPRGTKRKRGAQKTSGSRNKPDIIEIDETNPPLQRNAPLYGSREFIFLESDDDLPEVEVVEKVCSRSTNSTKRQPRKPAFLNSNELAENVATQTRNLIENHGVSTQKPPPTQSVEDYNYSDFEDDNDIYSTRNIFDEKKALMKQKTKLLQSTPLSIPDLPVPSSPKVIDSEDEGSFVQTPVKTEVHDVSEDLDVSDISVGRLGTTKAMRQQKQLFNKLDILSDHLLFQDKSMEESFDDTKETLNSSFSRGITVRVCWGTDYLKFPLEERDTLFPIYKNLAEKNSVSIGNIFLSFKNETLSPSTKLTDVGYTIADTIEGGLVNMEQTATIPTFEDPNSIKLKFQSKNKKETIELSVNKYDTFKAIKNHYIKKMNFSDMKIKFCFDGETIEDDETPFSSDFEGGECIDIFHS